jgi:tetratricopeptide (TPR) repeat protein
MPPSFDDHLDAVLRDCNNRIDQLEESGGTDEEMLDALINRGSVLSIMEYYTAALSDFDDAVDVIIRIEKAGKRVDSGSFVRVFVSRGELYGQNDADQMAEDYGIASTHLHDFGEDSKLYDRKKIILMCLDCCEDLLDNGHPEGTSPFVDKLYTMLAGHDDDWSTNRYLEMLNISAQTMNEMGMEDQAVEFFSDAIDTGYALLEKESLEDLMSLVFAFTLRGDIEQKKGLFEQYFSDRKSAISLLEELLSMNKLDDIQVLVKLHQDVAGTYLTLNKVKEAEAHLMREVMLNIDGAEEYIREFVDRSNS